MPPRAVRFHETCGLALIAIVAMVPARCASDGVPPGVNVGVAVAARCATYCVYAGEQDHREPERHDDQRAGEDPVGSPMAMIAARATIATADERGRVDARARARASVGRR